MAFDDDYSGQTGQPGDSDDDSQRRRMMEFILRSALKPTLPKISPIMNEQDGGEQTSVLLKKPNTQYRGSTGATPTNEPSTAHKDPYGQRGYTPSSEPARPRAPKIETTGLSSSRTVDGDSGGTSTSFASSRPNIPAPRMADTSEPSKPPDIENTAQLLGRGNMPLLGRGSAPTRPNVQPMRSDFPEKPLPGWEKALGIAAAPFLPNVSSAILGGPRRAAERQYESASKDWQLGQEGEERQARTEEAQARTRALNNPPPKEGTTPEDVTLHDLMTGGPNGGPKINPQTQKPYEYLEAYSAVQQAKTGAAQAGKQPPLAPEDISQINAMHQQQFQTLNPGKPLPPAFTLRPGSTQADYDRVHSSLSQLETGAGTAAQREATNTARTQAELDRQEARRERQSEKDLQSVYAYDPKSKQTILTTYGEARDAKMPGIRKVGQPDIEKDTQTVRQLGDAQMNFSSYRMALLRMQGLSGYEIARVGDLIGDSKFKAHFLGLELPSDWANELRQNNDWTKLPPDAQEAVVQYLSARPAVISYLRALNPGTRLNDAMIQTEMRNVPSPTDPPNVQESKFKRLQRNMEQASKALPRIPGLDSPEDVRQKTEVLTPQAPNPQQPQPQPARKSPKQALTDWLNRKVGAQ